MGVALKGNPSRVTTGIDKRAALRPAALTNSRDRRTSAPTASRRSSSHATRSPAAKPRPAAPSDVVAAAKRRRVIVFGGLVSTITLTAALLLAVQPAPLRPDAVKSLMAVTTEAQVNDLLRTQVPVAPGRWRYIYIHHLPAGTDVPPGVKAGRDHFVIGSGTHELQDGEVQVGTRWDGQSPAERTPGLNRLEPDCISIGVQGDFDRVAPTPRQMEQLTRLVTALQDRLRITREQVWILGGLQQVPAGCGRLFPQEAFKELLLP